MKITSFGGTTENRIISKGGFSELNRYRISEKILVGKLDNEMKQTLKEINSICMSIDEKLEDKQLV